MRIHPRYFNKFMIVVAVVTAILIVIATLSYTSSRESAFQRQMMEADSLGYVAFPYIESRDTLLLNQLRGQYLLLDFWSTWSEPSIESHKVLSKLPEEDLKSLRVVAASVRTDSSEVAAYRQKYNYAFKFVDGIDFYREMNLPGVPSQILFNPGGQVVATFVGYTGPSRYDSLKTHLTNE